MMQPRIYINGKFYNKEDARISVFDHGLLYGDGVFEGIRSYNRLVFRLKEHIDRLYKSAEGIKLNIPISKSRMTIAVCKALKFNNLDNAYIRLIITRGKGDLGLDPRRCKDGPQIIIITDKIALYPKKFYKDGLAIISAPGQQMLPRALKPQIKSLNYLNNILVKIEAIKNNCEEAAMLNEKGHVTECTGDNIFIIKNKVIYTPPTSIGILEGITRDAVIKIARRKRLKVKESIFTCRQLRNADECFLTGTAAEIIPVTKVDKKIISRGRPAKITLMLMEEFHKVTKKDGVRY